MIDPYFDYKCEIVFNKSYMLYACRTCMYFHVPNVIWMFKAPLTGNRVTGHFFVSTENAGMARIWEGATVVSQNPPLIHVTCFT